MLVSHPTPLDRRRQLELHQDRFVELDLHRRGLRGLANLLSLWRDGRVAGLALGGAIPHRAGDEAPGLAIESDDDGSQAWLCLEQWQRGANGIY